MVPLGQRGVKLQEDLLHLCVHVDPLVHEVPLFPGDHAAPAGPAGPGIPGSFAEAIFRAYLGMLLTKKKKNASFIVF